jgi:hypothetical protein
MDDLKPDPATDVSPATPYESPAIEQRSSSRDPLVWTVTSPICI